MWYRSYLFWIKKNTEKGNISHRPDWIICSSRSGSIWCITKADANHRFGKVKDLVLSHEYVRQIHGFYMDKEKKTMRFDIVVSFDAEDRRAVYCKVIEAVGKEYPGYEMQVAMDTDFSED